MITTTTTTKTTMSTPGQQPQQTHNRKLSRSESLERIRKFNTYLCSQSFYILPALLTWLRAPHDKLHAKLQTITANLKHIFFSTFLPRYAFHLLTTKAIPTLKAILDSTSFITTAVYTGIVIIGLQLIICIYYLSGVLPSGGFLFLISCLYLITQMNFSCLVFYVEKQEAEDSTCLMGGRIVPVQKRLSRKDILGKRTISNMNLI